MLPNAGFGGCSEAGPGVCDWAGSWAASKNAGRPSCRSEATIAVARASTDITVTSAPFTRKKTPRPRQAGLIARLNGSMNARVPSVVRESGRKQNRHL